MGKRNKKETKVMSTDEMNQLHHTVTIEVWKLMEAGKINHTLLLFKQVPEDFRGVLVVSAPGRMDEAVRFKVLQVMKVGGGYLPEGYPESFRVRGSGNALRVSRMDDLEAVAAEAAPDDAPGDQAIASAPTEDEGQE